MSSIFSVEIPADLETPVSAYLKLKECGACFLFESAENNEAVGRYSFIGINNILRVGLEDKTDSLDFLRKHIVPTLKNAPPLLGGLVGYIGYEVANVFDALPMPQIDQSKLPNMYMIRPESLVVFDHFKRKIGIFTVTPGNLSKITKALKLALPTDVSNKKSVISIKPKSNLSRAEFQRIVQMAKRYILEGDIFQVVLSHCISGTTSADPFLVYRAMRMLNPSPYMFFFDAKDFCLVGSSPEMLVKCEDGKVVLRPIAGTRRRGATQDEDIKLEDELLANVKENAEHSMLVDLGRNDIGRVCEFGSVILKEHKKVERYSHVMHLVSTVTGKLRKGEDMFDLFRAAFPAGTVTGAPKIRAMEIITELENAKRGPYAGAMGYFGGNGNMDMCITIRTIVFKGNRYFIQGGAGIVYDSVPSQEYDETLNKIAAMRKAIELAERGDWI